MQFLRCMATSFVLNIHSITYIVSNKQLIAKLKIHYFRRQEVHNALKLKDKYIQSDVSPCFIVTTAIQARISITRSSAHTYVCIMTWKTLTSFEKETLVCCCYVFLHSPPHTLSRTYPRPPYGLLCIRP